MSRSLPPHSSAPAETSRVDEPAARGSDIEGPDIEGRVRRAALAALDRKAEGVRVLALHEVTDFTDYFLICTGASERQISAIAEHVEASLRSAEVRPLHVEGSRGGWVLLDYGDFVVHVFGDDQRAFYGLERLWGDAPDVSEELTS